MSTNSGCGKMESFIDYYLGGPSTPGTYGRPELGYNEFELGIGGATPSLAAGALLYVLLLLLFD